MIPAAVAPDSRETKESTEKAEQARQGRMLGGDCYPCCKRYLRCMRPEHVGVVWLRIKACGVPAYLAVADSYSQSLKVSARLTTSPAS